MVLSYYAIAGAIHLLNKKKKIWKKKCKTNENKIIFVSFTFFYTFNNYYWTCKPFFKQLILHQNHANLSVSTAKNRNHISLKEYVIIFNTTRFVWCTDVFEARVYNISLGSCQSPILYTWCDIIVYVYLIFDVDTKCF
jgi:hypothetical protein